MFYFLMALMMDVSAAQDCRGDIRAVVGSAAQVASLAIERARESDFERWFGRLSGRQRRTVERRLKTISYIINSGVRISCPSQCVGRYKTAAAYAFLTSDGPVFICPAFFRQKFDTQVL